MNDTRDSGPDDSWPRRFSWPMRLFLCYFLFDMVVRSLLSLTDCDSTWNEEYGIAAYPAALPTPAELEQVAKASPEKPLAAKAERLWQSVRTVGPYFSPMPSDETRAKLETPEDVGKYAITWTVTRLAFVGHSLGVDQDWPMFSPNVGTDETLGRLRLVFADGASEIQRHIADPEDLTWFSHWFEEKPLQVVLKIHSDEDQRLGYCMWLAKQRPKNDTGSPLVRIEVFEVWYTYPTPDDDARAYLIAQTGPPPEQQGPVFWIYDVATRTGRWIR